MIIFQRICPYHQKYLLVYCTILHEATKKNLMQLTKADIYYSCFHPYEIRDHISMLNRIEDTLISSIEPN